MKHPRCNLLPAQRPASQNTQTSAQGSSQESSQSSSQDASRTIESATARPADQTATDTAAPQEAGQEALHETARSAAPVAADSTDTQAARDAGIAARPAAAREDGVSDDGDPEEEEDTRTFADSYELSARSDAAMRFIARAGGRLDYHQAAILRLASIGIHTPAQLQEATYVLQCARQAATAAGGADIPSNLRLDDPFNDAILDYIEAGAGYLSYYDAEIIRRIARGRAHSDLDEIAYLLERVGGALSRNR